VSWPIQINVVVVDAVLVVLHHLLDAVDTRVENIAVHGETVRWLLGERVDGAAEAEQIDLLVRVVVLEDGAHLVDHLDVLVLVHVPVVQ